MKTKAAQAAQLIRKEIKSNFPGLEFSCRSENFSGGNSIDISFTDQSPELTKQVKEMTSKYVYGHFNGMGDYYDISNARDDIPQVKYLFVKNEMSDVKKQELYERLRKNWDGGLSLPALYIDGWNIFFHGSYVSDLIWQSFNGRIQI